MNAKQFFDTVVELRYYQKQYFATRAKDALETSKKLEKQIDDEIKRVNTILAERAKQKN